MTGMKKKIKRILNGINYRRTDTRSGRSKTVRGLMQRLLDAVAPQITRLR